MPHYLAAGDAAGAARTLGNVAERMAMSPDVGTVAAWLGQIPPEIADMNPSLVAARSRILFAQGDLEGAVAAIAAEPERMIALGEHELAARAVAHFAQAVGLNGGGQDLVVAFARQHLPRIGEDAPSVALAHALVAGMLGYASRYAEAEAELELHATLKASRSELQQAYAQSIRAFFVDYPRGDLRGAAAS